MRNIIIVLICLFGLLFALNFFIYDDKDSCLSGGVCKEGMTVKNSDTGEEFIINQDTCIKYNGLWREKYNDCYFKN